MKNKNSRGDFLSNLSKHNETDNGENDKMQKEVQHVFLVGAKSLGMYGGYETFVDKLIQYHENNKKLKYHVACKKNGPGSMNPYNTQGVRMINDDEFIYHNAHCFRIKVPQSIGSAQAIYYDVAALRQCCSMIQQEHIPHPIVYIMACRIGPFIKHFYEKIHELEGKVYINPDGHEWMRAKWSGLVRKYWKMSEQMMVKYCDLVICDSINIEQYIREQYEGKKLSTGDLKTVFIAYGAETKKAELSDNDVRLAEWYKTNGLKKKKYYLVVGRFVPENNYEIMLREFMKSKTKKDFVIITNGNDKFLRELEKKLSFKKDSRIKFVGTVYNQELLKKIREDAYGYLHGHEVGGTNPSLLEALGSTDLNLLLDVGFNREVAKETAIYWTKEDDNLARVIEKADGFSEIQIQKMGENAKRRIRTAYSWEHIARLYEKVFL